MARPTTVDAVAVQDRKFGRFGMGSIPDVLDERDYDYRRVVAEGGRKVIPESVSLAEHLPKESWNQDVFGASPSFSANLLVSVAREKSGHPYSRPSWMATWHWTKLEMYGPELAKKDLGCDSRRSVLSTKKQGVAPARLFPYEAQRLRESPGQDVLAGADPNGHTAFFRIDDFKDGIELDFVYRCLAEGWPVMVSLPIYDSFQPDYRTGHVPYPSDDDELKGYQTLVIYGYYLEGRNPYFRVRNSWGGHWGGRHLLPSGKQVEPGTCRVPIDYIGDMGYDFWTIRVIEKDTVEGVPLHIVLE